MLVICGGGGKKIGGTEGWQQFWEHQKMFRGVQLEADYRMNLFLCAKIINSNVKN